MYCNANAFRDFIAGTFWGYSLLKNYPRYSAEQKSFQNTKWQKNIDFIVRRLKKQYEY